MIDLARQAAVDEGVAVSTSKLCQWFDIPRRSAYYRSQRSAPKVQPCFAEPIKAMIEENPSFGYRTVARPLTESLVVTNSQAMVSRKLKVYYGASNQYFSSI